MCESNKWLIFVLRVKEYIKSKPCPISSIKIDGVDKNDLPNTGINSKHAVETFFRNITGGLASSRFHRRGVVWDFVPHRYIVLNQFVLLKQK